MNVLLQRNEIPSSAIIYLAYIYKYLLLRTCISTNKLVIILESEVRLTYLCFLINIWQGT